MTSLADFLRRNTIELTKPLPLVHSTQALLLKKFMVDNKISPSWCDVFNKDTSYFFVGRPGYKHQITDEEIAYWQLPVCFIFEYSAVPAISKIHPFDSGAHNDNRMPSFIQMIDRTEYEVDGGIWHKR